MLSERAPTSGPGKSLRGAWHGNETPVRGWIVCFSRVAGSLGLPKGNAGGAAFHFFLGALSLWRSCWLPLPSFRFRKRPIDFQLRIVLFWPVGGDRQSVNVSLQLSATDVSAQTTMKGAAKCDKHCDLQNSVNQQELERILRFRDTPESMPASVSASVSCC